MREEVAKLFGLDEDSPLLDEALTHSSYANEQRGTPDNQRLEFLGDAVLGFCTSQFLFERHPGADEGSLTRMRAQLVNTKALASWARSHHISEALRLGRGATGSGDADRTNVLADAVEALIAAAFLHGGMELAQRVCLEIVSTDLDTLQGTARDPKSALQERIQARGAPSPTYRVIDSGGPDHQRWFVVGVFVGSLELAEGRGRSKRVAERMAAQNALEKPLDELLPDSLPVAEPGSER